MLFCKISEHILDEILIFGKVQIIVSTDYFTKPIVKLHATLTLEFSRPFNIGRLATIRTLFCKKSGYVASDFHYRWVAVQGAVADVLSSFKSGFRPK